MVHVCNSKFQESAFGLLEELYKSDQVKTKQLVKRPLKNWNGSSVYKLAVEADFPNFKTHDSFQGCLDEMWYGELRTNVPLWKVRHFAVCVCMRECVCVCVRDDSTAIANFKLIFCTATLASNCFVSSFTLSIHVYRARVNKKIPTFVFFHIR